MLGIVIGRPDRVSGARLDRGKLLHPRRAVPHPGFSPKIVVPTVAGDIFASGAPDHEHCREIRIVREHMTRARRRGSGSDHLMPSAAIPYPRVREPSQSRLAQRSTEQHSLTARGVKSHAVSRARHWTYRSDNLSPIRPVPSPGVVCFRKVPIPAKQNHLLSNGVVCHRVALACGRTHLGMRFGPVRPIPNPSLVAVCWRHATDAAEQHNLSASFVVSHRMLCQHPRIVGRLELCPS